MKLASAVWGSFSPFDDFDLFDDFYTASKSDDLQEDSCLVVWGGGDISPSLYNKKPGSYTHAGPSLSHRDAVEWTLMQRAKEMGLPIIGVCRGGQMLCALAGGFLVQDVTGHGRSHSMDTKDGERITTSSLHHQMMNPEGTEHVMLAWTTNKLSQHYMSVDDEGKDKSIHMPIEPEAIWFNKEKGFALQGHPEFMRATEPYNRWVKKQIEHLIMEK